MIQAVGTNWEQEKKRVYLFWMYMDSLTLTSDIK